MCRIQELLSLLFGRELSPNPNAQYHQNQRGYGHNLTQPGLRSTLPAGDHPKGLRRAELWLAALIRTIGKRVNGGRFPEGMPCRPRQAALFTVHEAFPIIIAYSANHRQVPTGLLQKRLLFFSYCLILRCS